jgi:CRP-like cAMP-binding protein
MKSMLPFLSPYDRMRLLQSLPFFETLEAEDLSALAEHAEEEHKRRGAPLIERGSQVDAVRVLVEGEAEMRRRGVLIRRIVPGSPIGFISMLADDEETEIFTTTRATSLMIRRSIWFDMLEDRFSILQHVLVAAARQLRRECVAGGFLPEARPSERTTTALDDEFERFLALREHLPFGKRHLFGLWNLARRVSPAHFSPGEPLFHEGQASADMILLTHGRARCRLGAEQTFGPGSTLGVFDALAEETRSYSATAETPCAGIRIDREELLDVFEDHFDLARDCLTKISLSVLEAMERRAALSKEVPSGFARFS